VSQVADTLRQGQRERLAQMTPDERLREALALGQRDIEAYAAAHGVDRQEARRQLERAAQTGRLFSRVMLEIIG
jgi:tRNA A37 N6-isopentenylltransferase MiaA